MALTRRDLFLASIVGFVAWGYLVHWLPVLRYLGYAFVSGVAVTVLLLLALTLTSSRPASQRQAQAQRQLHDAPNSGSSLGFLGPKNWMKETAAFRAERRYEAAQIYPSSFVISDALDGLLASLFQDVIGSWYGNITADQAFVNGIDRNFRLVLENLQESLAEKDVVDIVVSKIVPLITLHLRDFDQAERAIRGKLLNRNVTESEELDLAIAAKYREGKLHSAAHLSFSETKPLLQGHLRKIVENILPMVLPEDMCKSRVVMALIKEIVTCAVLSPLMQLLADPDTWNQLVEAYGRVALQDRKTVRKLRAALDEHASPPPKTRGHTFPRLAPGDNERSFERFVRAIRHASNLSDVRRFRSHVASQLRREGMVDNQDQTYLRRLEIGKRVLDQKVLKLTNGESGANSAGLMLSKEAEIRKKSPTTAENVSLVALMKTASGLSYFMEYMDRSKLMSLVQFWIVVDGFRNPLEDDFGDEASTVDSISWTETDRVDIAQISEAYMSRPELKVSDGMRAATKDFLRAGRKATPHQYRRARSAILCTQSAVLEEMETRHFAEFKATDLYYKFLASDEASAATHSSGTKEMLKSPLWNGHEETALQPPQAPPMIRSSSQPAPRAHDLRRTALSAVDIRPTVKPAESFGGKEYRPLFDDDDDTDPLANSTYSISKESQASDTATQKLVIENMEAALNNIFTETPKLDESLEPVSKLFGSPTSVEKGSLFDDSPRDSLDASRGDDKARPNISSLGLVNTSSRIGVFSDDDLFGDEKKFIEDEYADSEHGSQCDDKEEEIHEAAPGDLGLAEAVAALTSDVERLVAQELVVDTLTRKAELTNNTAELRILGKSKASLQREIRRKELQRQQYIVQESDNSLYGRSNISIKSIMVGKEEDGHEYALYVIEVQRKAGDQMGAASWVIARRFSEFHDLHHHLRARFPSVRNLDFPRRRMVMKLQREFLHKRRVGLEGYLGELLLLPEVCRSRELRSFLSQQEITPLIQSTSESDAKDIVTRIYKSVTDGMDDFLGNMAVLDQLSAAGQNLMSAAANTAASGVTDLHPDVNGNGLPISSSSVATDPTSVAEVEAELSDLEQPFVKPICDLFLEAFDLTKGNNWLRGRAVVVVLHQLLGGTVERKVRDSARALFQEDAVLRYIELVRTVLWPIPGGGLREGAHVRTVAEKSRSKAEASLLLGSLVPDLAGNVVGRANAQAAARRVFATLNNERLNTHLVFTVLDEVVGVLFGEGVVRGR